MPMKTKLLTNAGWRPNIHNEIQNTPEIHQYQNQKKKKLKLNAIYFKTTNVVTDSFLSGVNFGKKRSGK